MTASLLRRLATAAVVLSASASLASAQTLLGDVTGNGSGRAIADLSTTTSTITLANAGFVLGAGNNVTVRINGLSHTFMNDLAAFLVYTPTGGGPSIEAVLFDNVGGNGDPHGSFSFNSGFGTSIGSINLAGGDFAPLGSLAVFNGVSVAGDWTLRVEDQVGADAGSYQSWDIGLATTTTTPEPGTWALMGSGLLGLAGVAHRRRKA
ncbi:PEP-CTERM sorting domain-containing protein [Roseisolibacter agri]|uniref:PEP-CTERM sorting domain-containing protein n=1 Tax=Roseisolibacter agri TaxID=2014610 RepID=A0AA37QEM5_9BACT|nr:PEP-CTERM sorting domain-containing protein [Roseisolibacter agri]GLC24338.1 hypothetical protein rosag_08510 [Roseisolibacter agri]